MKSHEAIAVSINRSTVEHAKALHLSLSSIHKWKEPNTDFSDSGSHNPLDRIETIIETSIKLGNPVEVALSPVFYLASRFNFVPLILPAVPPNLAEISKQLNHLIKDFGRLIEESAAALDDGRISTDERKKLDACAQHVLAATGTFMTQIAEVAK
ncbi:MAG: hypothetical protein Q7U74_08180 [Saprospiraceae bacterium]|nr:hypothetical protein [Saprospiraceae bacterium]